MHGARAARGLGGPGHAALHRQVDLERPRTVAVAAVGAGHPPGQTVTGQLRHAARGQVQDHRVRGGQLVQRSHLAAGLDASAVLAHHSGKRVGDGSRSAARHRPAEAVAGTDQRHAHGRAHRPVQRAERVRGHAAEQRAGLLGGEGAAQQRGRGGGGQAEAHQGQRMGRQVLDRPQQVVQQLAEVARRAPEHPSPRRAVAAEPRRSRLDRALHHGHAAAVQRMGQVELGPRPLEPVALEAQPCQRGRAWGQRVRCRAVVVQQAGQRQLAGAGAAADHRSSLDDRDRHAARGQGGGAGQAVGARADHDGAAHAAGVTRTGNGRPSSQGWRETMSATSTSPSSITPVAASRIR